MVLSGRSSYDEAVSDDGFGRAPHGLEFLQAFLNTGYHAPPDGIDPLSDTNVAQAWLESALARFQPRAAARVSRDGQPGIVLDPHDVKSLRGVRLALTELVAQGRGSRALTANLRVGIDDDGNTVVEPRGSGAGQVLGILLSEILVAQQIGTWARLKICRNHKCAIAFYDHSPNASAVWHNAKRCGNAVNLRRSRRRRRTDTP